MPNIKIYLKYLYYKTIIHQKIYKDGTFPFKYYDKLTTYVNKYNVSNALECGTAIGLTAISIAIGNDNVKLDTIEKHQRNIEKAKNNFNIQKGVLSKFIFNNKIINNKLRSALYRVNFICDRYLNVLESSTHLSDETIIKKYNLIFLDAYVSRINEVKFLTNYLSDNGILIVSNIRENIPKSLEAKNFLLSEQFELLEICDDTIFVKKR